MTKPIDHISHQVELSPGTTATMNFEFVKSMLPHLVPTLRNKYPNLKDIELNVVEASEIKTKDYVNYTFKINMLFENEPQPLRCYCRIVLPDPSDFDHISYLKDSHEDDILLETLCAEGRGLTSHVRGHLTERLAMQILEKTYGHNSVGPEYNSLEEGYRPLLQLAENVVIPRLIFSESVNILDSDEYLLFSITTEVPKFTAMELLLEDNGLTDKQIKEWMIDWARANDAIINSHNPPRLVYSDPSNTNFGECFYLNDEGELVRSSVVIDFDTLLFLGNDSVSKPGYTMVFGNNSIRMLSNPREQGPIDITLVQYFAYQPYAKMPPEPNNLEEAKNYIYRLLLIRAFQNSTGIKYTYLISPYRGPFEFFRGITQGREFTDNELEEIKETMLKNFVENRLSFKQQSILNEELNKIDNEYAEIINNLYLNEQLMANIEEFDNEEIRLRSEQEAEKLKLYNETLNSVRNEQEDKAVGQSIAALVDSYKLILSADESLESALNEFYKLFGVS